MKRLAFPKIFGCKNPSIFRKQIVRGIRLVITQCQRVNAVLSVSRNRQRVGAFQDAIVEKNAFKHSYTVKYGNRLVVGVLRKGKGTHKQKQNFPVTARVGGGGLPTGWPGVSRPVARGQKFMCCVRNPRNINIEDRVPGREDR